MLKLLTTIRKKHICHPKAAGLKISKQLKVFCLQHRKKILLLATLATLIMLLVPEIVFADYETQRTEWLQDAQTALSTAMLFIQSLLWPILLFMGPLLDNSTLFGATVDESKTMEDMLLGIWVQIRNIVNIAFVIILLFVALYNVIGRTEGEFVLKSMLPRIVIGLIAVNFSFLICKVVLDATNVATNALVAIPINIIDSNEYSAKITEMEKTICKDSSDNPQPLDEATLKTWSLEGICNADGTFKEDIYKEDKTDSFLYKFDHKNLAFIMSAHIGKLSKFKFVSQELTIESTGEDVADTIMKLLLDIGVSVIIVLLYAVSIIALFFVLVARVVVLWAMIALSPLLVLFMVIPQLSQGMEEFDFKKTFVQHAIAPIMITGALAIGFIMLDAMTNPKFELPEGLLKSDSVGGFLDSFGSGTLGDFLALITGVGVIWMGVFGAASKTYASFITDKIRDYTQAGAKFVAKLPLYAATVPVTTITGKDEGDKKISLGHGLQTIGAAFDKFEEDRSGRGALEKAVKGTGLAQYVDTGLGYKNDVFNSKTKEGLNNTVHKYLTEVTLDRAEWNELGKHLKSSEDTSWKDLGSKISAANGDKTKILNAINGSPLKTHHDAIQSRQSATKGTDGETLNESTDVRGLLNYQEKTGLTGSDVSTVKEDLKPLAQQLQKVTQNKSAIISILQRISDKPELMTTVLEQASKIKLEDDPDFMETAVSVASGENLPSYADDDSKKVEKEAALNAIAAARPAAASSSATAASTSAQPSASAAPDDETT